MIKNDNILALASPSGIGAISMIRISGSESISIADKIFNGVEKIKLKDQKANTVQLGYIVEDDRTIDKVLITVFRNPKSYTGEDLVEISCHGSIFIQESIIQLLLNHNCRVANPGEFTMRSFLNGKMDLSQAESVADLISSNTEASHRLAMNQMRGGFKNDINDLRSELVNFASLIELELDFSQEDVEFANKKELNKLLDKITFILKKLIDSFKTGNVIKNGIPIAIVGEPNTGKSTLLNTLLNEERAIVSSIAGTTRDTIEDQININGVKCRFIDTAGIRNTEDEIENIGIERTFKKMNESEIIIFLIDYSTLNKEKLNHYVNYLTDIDNKFPNAKLITLLNKNDIKSETLVSDLDEFNPISISAKNKLNIDNLRDEIISYINNLTSQIDNYTISNSRHYDLLNKTYEEIHKVKISISKNISSDLLAIDIKQAIYFLGELTGEISNDEVLGNIFSKFCIGK
ncbi:MAG: tRNA uridine-5-carboxymethylaminomethyl(34) synthesis GTPase MnmE [Flavobacteriaceae bacterium]|nr:tRNA uridine-5-carboxymethylaminomethyl(34) synthesis GTPase MnmE [Flavobacteriaceae bacterium]MAU31429.1 tRNA uridine-5-carboxymethylaminomethyl(34) synthesis GTPase MnmE [Flavobacteriaceae bacterium]